MAVQVMVPQEGSMERCTIAKWHVRVGDTVTAGELLCEVETDKTTFDLESPGSGTMLEILQENGAEVPVLTTIAVIGEVGEDYADLLPGRTLQESERAVERKEAHAGAMVSSVEGHGAESAAAKLKVLVSPRAKRLLREYDVPQAALKGSGPNGSIVERDVLAYREAREEAEKPAATLAGQSAIAPQPNDELTLAGVIPYAGIRRTVGERMTDSASTKPTAALTLHADASALVEWRARLKTNGITASYNDLLVKILAKAVADFPIMNARLSGNDIELIGEINVGVAVDTEKGLYVPVIHHADEKSVAQIAGESSRKVAAVKAGEATAADLTGGTVTLTNLGMYEIEQFTPIINPSECCILAVGAIVKQPVVDAHDNVAVRQVMQLTLVFDHRIVDGAPAARFLQRVKHIVEWPLELVNR